MIKYELNLKMMVKYFKILRFKGKKKKKFSKEK